MRRNLNKIIGVTTFIVILFACSTEKNTFINRQFHSINAHYNGYFNANELLRQSMDTYRNSAQEDYYNILPLELVPDEEEVKGMYPAIDTAISKCKKVIQDHSMPSNDRPQFKKEEHNRWIDENWTTIGIASYYRRDYEGAMKSFKFVKKFYKNDPSLYVGELWMAKTSIAKNDLTKAKFSLDKLDQVLEKENTKEEKPKSKLAKKRAKKEVKPAKFPKKIRFEFEKTKAELALAKEDVPKAIEYLEESLKHTRKSKEKTRVHFILGQLYEGQGEDIIAGKHYAKVLKGNAPFQMAFNARLKKAFLSSGDNKRKQLNKMLKDAKNAEYKDQIYYALAGIEFKEGNEEAGIANLHKCAFYSTKNTRQKGMAYEDLGDRRFDKRDYVNAQKYYDSCAAVINDEYPNAEAIRAKAKNLESLVVAVETAYYEDSVQRIAMLSEKDREDFLKQFIKDEKKREEERKKREAERLKELQSNENLFVQSGSGSKWYWNNAKLRGEGVNEFKRLWGVRDNEDDWRRSNKTTIGTFVGEDGEEIPLDSIPEEKDTLTVEHLLTLLPLSDSAMAASTKRLLEARYNAGLIYKEQLNEAKLAEKEFDAVLERKAMEDPHDLLASFQSYKLHNGTNPSEAKRHKEYILNNYPNSDYANFLRDPDYFVKKKERDALAEKEYVKVLDRYDRGLYYPVLTKSNLVIRNEKDNVYRAKYMLLKALVTGQLNEDKNLLIPILDTVIIEYPGSSEAERAQELIDIIKNGVSENIEAVFGSNSPFTYDDNASNIVIIFLEEGQNSNTSKTKIVDFHREFFSRDRLRVDSKIYGKSSVILVSEFDEESKGSEYIRVYKKTRKHLLDLQKAKILMITKANLKVLFEKQNLAEYESFYDEYY